MNFFSPYLLFGCLFAVVPVLLHFISYSKKKDISYLSTFRFFENINFIQKKKTKIKDILLMLIRMLLVISIVLFFAHPYQKIILNKNLQKQVIVLIDRTASMQKNQKEVTTKIKKKIEELQKKNNFSQLQLGYILSPNINSNPALSPRLAVRFVENINSFFLEINNFPKSYFTANHADALAMAISSFEEDKEKILIVVSDFQKNNWQLNRSYQLRENLTIEWLQIGTNVFQNNLSIEDVNVLSSNNFSSNFLKVTVKNNGLQEKNANLVFENISMPFSLAAKTITNLFLKDRERNKKKSKKNFAHKVFLEVDDDYSADNEFYFSLQKNRQIRVALIGDFSLKATQKNFSLLQTLLKSGEKRFSIQIKSIDIKTIKENFDFSQQIYFFLNGSERLSQFFFSSLEKKKNKIFFLFPYADFSQWQKLLKKISPIMNIKIKKEKKGNFLISSFHEQNSLTKIFINEEGDIFQFPINQYLSLKLPKASIPLLTIEEDAFFSQYSFFDNNQIFIVASGLDNSFGDFNFSYTFVILMSRIVENYFQQQNFIVKQQCQLFSKNDDVFFSKPGVYSHEKKIYQVNVSRKESSQQKISSKKLMVKKFQQKQKSKWTKKNSEFKSYRFSIVLAILVFLFLEFLLSNLLISKKSSNHKNQIINN